MPGPAGYPTRTRTGSWSSGWSGNYGRPGTGCGSLRTRSRGARAVKGWASAKSSRWWTASCQLPRCERPTRRSRRSTRVARSFSLSIHGGEEAGRRRIGSAAWPRCDCQVVTNPPSIVTSEPATLLVRSLASTRTASATSAGFENRPVTAIPAACAVTSSGASPVACETVAAMPSTANRRPILTRQELTVLTRIPRPPTALDTTLKKCTRAAGSGDDEGDEFRAREGRREVTLLDGTVGEDVQGGDQQVPGRVVLSGSMSESLAATVRPPRSLPRSFRSAPPNQPPCSRQGFPEPERRRPAWASAGACQKSSCLLGEPVAEARADDQVGEGGILVLLRRTVFSSITASWTAGTMVVTASSSTPFSPSDRSSSMPTAEAGAARTGSFSEPKDSQQFLLRLQFTVLLQDGLACGREVSAPGHHSLPSIRS